LEGTFKGHVVQPPCNEQGQKKTDRIELTSLGHTVTIFQLLK